MAPITQQLIKKPRLYGSPNCLPFLPHVLPWKQEEIICGFVWVHHSAMCWWTTERIANSLIILRVVTLIWAFFQDFLLPSFVARPMSSDPKSLAAPLGPAGLVITSLSNSPLLLCILSWRSGHWRCSRWNWSIYGNVLLRSKCESCLLGSSASLVCF